MTRAAVGSTAAGARTFRAFDPAAGRSLEPAFTVASAADVDAALTAAAAAFAPYVATPAAARAAFLRRIASELERAKAPLVERANHETALGVGRLEGELARTTGQLRMFADLIERPDWLAAVDAGGEPTAQPPKPDIRSLRRALGPVVVFGASNFPLAFSVAGGDTASALAAGCPVICKAHPSHPGTSRLAADAVSAAVAASGLPDGVFALLLDDGHEVGRGLVSDPRVKAVGFTGSRAGGEALMRLAAERPEPIPVYAEMGSVNPVFVLAEAANARADAIAEGLHASFTLGVGQFCTNPGVVLVPVGR
ncbi:MAG TPA: aldehyde dehydrogenase family protein, partial [Trueperaceae bacterium]|nr:aldehyde dehydrogenase family protein [Trueperaceae bacterium]